MDDTISQMLADLNQSVGAVAAQVADVKDDTHYLRGSVDAIKRTVAEQHSRIAVLESRETDARWRLKTMAAWFGAVAGGAGIVWDLIVQFAANGRHG